MEHAQKGASEAPRTHFRACKISNFPIEGMPPAPLTQSISWSPHLLFALGPSNLLSDPANCFEHACENLAASQSSRPG